MARQMTFKTFINRTRKNLYDGLIDGSYKFGSTWIYTILHSISFVFLIFIAIVLCCFLDHRLFNDVLFHSFGTILFNNPGVEQACSESNENIYKLIENGNFISASDFLETISGFYNSIITVLTSLIAILGIVSFFYLKNLSVQSAYEIVDKALDKKLNADSINQAINSDESWNNYLQRLNNMSDRYDSIKSEINGLRNALQALAFNTGSNDVPIRDMLDNLEKRIMKLEKGEE